MAKVYIVQKPLEKRGVEWVKKFPHMDAMASKWGEPVYLVEEPHIADGQPLIDMMQQRLQDFTEEDYLLPVGSPVAIVAASMVASHNTDGLVNVLHFDKFANDYFCSTLEDA